MTGDNFVQWDYVLNELRNDQDSRRAVIHIRSPWDSMNAKLDVPCTMTLQFLIRDQELHLVVSMRSSDIILGLTYDVPAFTMFQEQLANELGIGVGRYIHVSNSLHIYDRHFAMAESILSPEEIGQSKLEAIACGEMPVFDGKVPIDELMEFEDGLWKSKSSSEIRELFDAFCMIERDDINYWIDFCKILIMKRCNSIIGLDRKEYLDALSYQGFRKIGGYK